MFVNREYVVKVKLDSNATTATRLEYLKILAEFEKKIKPYIVNAPNIRTI